MKTGKLIILCEKGSINSIKTILAKEKNARIVCLDEHIQKTLADEHIEHSVIQDYPLKESFERGAIDWLKDWATVPLLNGKDIKDIFAYRGISLWWFLELGFFESYRNLNHPISLKKLIETIEHLETILEIEMPSKVIFLNTDKPHNYFIANLCSILGYKTEHVKDKRVSFSSFLWKKCFPHCLRKFVQSRYAIRWICSRLFSVVKTHNDTHNQKYVIISHSINWKNGRDAIFNPLIERLKANSEVVRIDFPSSSFIGIMDLYEQKIQASLSLDFKSSEEYDVNRSNLAFEYKKMILAYEQMKQKKVYYKSYDISGIFYEILDFHIYHYYGIKTHMMYIETIMNIIDREKPKCLILTDEYNPIGRAAVSVGRLKGIKTIALQHGTISTDRPSFLHYENEISCFGECDTQYYPLPDVTAVFGSFYRDMLEDIGNYPPGSLVVTGSIRYDEILELNRTINKKAIFSKIGADENKKVLLYTSQPIAKEDSDKILRAIVSAVSKLPDFQLIIKLHPAEIKVNHDILSMVDEKIIVIKDINIYEIINVSDIMITYFSTTALEAMIMEKPVITINLTGKKDIIPYVQSGAALGVYSEEALIPVIKSVFEDRQLRAQLDINSKKFVYQNAYKIDGMATERVLNIIKDG